MKLEVNTGYTYVEGLMGSLVDSNMWKAYCEV